LGDFGRSTAVATPALSARPNRFVEQPSAIVSLLRETLRAPNYDPPLLPKVALDLLELSRDPAVDLKKILVLMESEPLIAGKVVSIAQSAFYSRGAPIETLNEAVTRLGIARLTTVFLEAAMKTAIFESDVFEDPMNELRFHSTATAHVARGLCRSLQLPGERAFLCGLLHDIGIAGCFIVLGQLPEEDQPEDFEEIAAAVREVHEEASAVMGQKWRLPWGVQWVVAHHHSFVVDGRINPLAGIVSLADWLAAEAGAPGLGEASEAEAMRVMDHFNFSRQTRTKLLDKCHQIVEQLR
jgi:putative nucleotidyltransferase with HDIG domain